MSTGSFDSVLNEIKVVERLNLLELLHLVFLVVALVLALDDVEDGERRISSDGVLFLCLLLLLVLFAVCVTDLVNFFHALRNFKRRRRSVGVRLTRFWFVLELLRKVFETRVEPLSSLMGNWSLSGFGGLFQDACDLKDLVLPSYPAHLFIEAAAWVFVAKRSLKEV